MISMNNNKSIINCVELNTADVTWNHLNNIFFKNISIHNQNEQTSKIF